MAKKKLYMVGVDVSRHYVFEVEASTEKAAEKAAKQAIEDNDAGEPEFEEVDVVDLYESSLEEE